MRQKIVVVVVLAALALTLATCTQARASDWDKPEVLIPVGALLTWFLIDSLSDDQKADLSKDLSDWSHILSPFLQKALKWAGLDDGNAASGFLSDYLTGVIGGLVSAAEDGDEALYEYLDNIEEPALKEFIKSEGGAKWLLGLVGRIDPRLRDALWRTENGIDAGVLPEAIQLLYLRGDLPEPTWAAFVDNVHAVAFSDQDLEWFITTLYENLKAVHAKKEVRRIPAEPSLSPDS